MDSKNAVVAVSSLGLALDFDSLGLMSGMELSFVAVTWGFFAMLPPAMVLELDVLHFFKDDAWMLIDQLMSWAQVLTVCSVMMSWHVNAGRLLG